MSLGFSRVLPAYNEPVLNYAPGSAERNELKKTLAEMRNQQVDVPMYIGGKEVRSNDTYPLNPPHDHQHVLGHYHKGTAQLVREAIQAALSARARWSNMPWEDRAAIFLKAADLLAGPWRARMNAATMLGQSKNAYQAEIDSACELIDFWRFNVSYMQEIYAQQPNSSKGVWNRLEQRPLEGFVFALTPFNFTAIAGNLPTAPAMMGNVAVWKPANSQIYSANIIMQILQEAGLPDGVINLVYADGPVPPASTPQLSLKRGRLWPETAQACALSLPSSGLFRASGRRAEKQARTGEKAPPLTRRAAPQLRRRQRRRQARQKSRRRAAARGRGGRGCARCRS